MRNWKVPTLSESELIKQVFQVECSLNLRLMVPYVALGHHVALRTGNRRSEAATLTLGDLTMEQGYSVAMIWHGKGNEGGSAKLPLEVCQMIDDYLAETGRTQVGPEAALFVSFRK